MDYTSRTKYILMARRETFNSLRVFILQPFCRYTIFARKVIFLQTIGHSRPVLYIYVYMSVCKRHRKYIAELKQRSMNQLLRDNIEKNLFF